MRIGSLILAGGQSQRMGRPKESLPFGEETLLHRIASTLRECGPVIVVKRDKLQALPDLPDDVHVITDQLPGRGPLAAIATGLRHGRERLGLARSDAMFVTGCDSPFLSATTVQWLADQLGEHQLVMPAPGGVLQPLCAVYRVGVADVAEDLLARDIDSPRALAAVTVTRLLDDDELSAHDPEQRFLRNVNTPDEYDRARSDLA